MCYGSIEGLAKQQNIMHFTYPIDSKSQDLTKFKSGTSHITHHTIPSHITFEFEVLQNIRIIMSVFFKNILKG